jgi:hypothetical protein
MQEIFRIATIKNRSNLMLIKMASFLWWCEKNWSYFEAFLNERDGNEEVAVRIPNACADASIAPKGQLRSLEAGSNVQRGAMVVGHTQTDVVH